MYLGSCAGSYDAATVPASFVAVCPAQADLRLLDARIWNETDTSWVGLQSPGVGVISVHNALPDHPIMQGMPKSFTMTHYNGPLFRGGTALGVVEGVTHRFTPSERFLTSAYTGPTLMERAADEGVANIVVGTCGQGTVVLFGSHPEFGASLPMDDANLSGRMLDNAVQWHVSAHGSRAAHGVRVSIHEAPVVEDDPVGSVTALVRRISERSARLQSPSFTRAAWLEPRYAMSTFGLSPREIWSLALVEIRRLSTLAEFLAPTVAPWALAYRQPAAWDVDGGFHGVIALLSKPISSLPRPRPAVTLTLARRRRIPMPSRSRVPSIWLPARTLPRSAVLPRPLSSAGHMATLRPRPDAGGVAARFSWGQHRVRSSPHAAAPRRRDKAGHAVRSAAVRAFQTVSRRGG